jgi:hypothetical protein
MPVRRISSQAAELTLLDHRVLMKSATALRELELGQRSLRAHWSFEPGQQCRHGDRRRLKAYGFEGRRVTLPT